MTTVFLTDEWTKSPLARAVPGSEWCPDRKGYVLREFTPRAATVALKLFPHLALEHPELAEARTSMLSDVRPFDNATPYGRRIAPARVTEVLDNLGWALFDFQAIDLGYLQGVLDQYGGGYIAWERGMGKTLAVCCLLDARDSQSALVVCPNTAKDSVWATALRKFCPWLEVVVLGNTKAKRERALRTCQQHRDTGTPFVLVCHYEALAVVAGKDKTAKGKPRIGNGWERLGLDFDVMTLDEGHRISNPDAAMSKAAKKVPAEVRVILSGSVFGNRLEELFSQLQFLYPDRYRSRWRDWNDRFLDYVENGYAKVCIGVQPDRVPALRQELGVFTVYRRKDDELDLPERMPDVHLRVDLSPAQRAAYDQLKAECLTLLDDGTKVKASQGIAMMTRLRQVATGLDLLSNEVNDSSKLDVAMDLILDSPDDDFTVFGWYKASLTALADRLAAKAIDCFLVTGDTPQPKRTEYIARFQAGEGKVFLGTIATLGESVELQRANQAVFIDRSWNPALNQQAEDRLYRQGQQRKVTITHLIAADTVDELHVMPNLASKEALRAAVLGT